ncbi:MAG: asparagine synthase (glutamine-hydrolyzing) [Solirubrobacterales bacterium]|nr:MAG: asparagine synthase (glutamine-hydrolyzing) [Solirubrobacterales bacterium]
MCGIAGVLNYDGSPVELEDLRRAAAAIAHRGPDDEGFHREGPVGLAHRRLSIIDLSPAGHGPMSNEDGAVWLSFNGEIYNFRELRRLLISRGHSFRSHNDGEVLVHGWEEWGTDLVERLNGIFAFAIWDGRNRQLFLARDRFGAKPLYVRAIARRLVFASEVKAILAYEGQGTSISMPALVEYLTFQNLYGENTLFDGVKMLRPGSWMLVETDGHTRSAVYFDPKPEPLPAGSPGQLSEELAAILEQAVDRQLMSDVPVGAYLSGGVDSASLVILAARSIPHMHTFTVGFDLAGASPLELGADERGDAEIVAREAGSEHYEAVLHAGDLTRVLPQLVWHLEDLRAGTCYQNYYVSRLASRFVKVVLAGVGGDEFFAGYPWRYALLDQLNGGDSFEDVYYRYWSRLVHDDDKQELFTADAWAEARKTSPRESFEAVLASLPSGLEPIDRALYFEQRTFLHGLLVVEDKLSMAHSLEARVPFLDNELVDFSLRLPGSLKNSSPEGKRLLRDASATFLPAALHRKRKQGFSPPDRTWYQGRNLRYVREILLDATTLSRGIFRPAFTERMIREHTEGQSDHRLLIWSLLCLEWWQRLFVDNKAVLSVQSPAVRTARADGA